MDKELAKSGQEKQRQHEVAGEKTKQDKTRQDKTRQNKTRQDKEEIHKCHNKFNVIILTTTIS